MDYIKFNVMIVGDGQTGKTCLSTSFNENTFPSPPIPPVYNVFNKDLTVHDKACNVNVREDVPLGENRDRRRYQSYPGTDVIIALYSVDSRQSFENVKNRWILEVRADLPTIPILMVANKTDLRASSECETVSYEEGYLAAKAMGTSYREVSCKQQYGIEECLEHVVELAIFNSPTVKEQFNMSTVVIPPFLPPPHPEPVKEVWDYDKPSSSTFASDWLPFLDDPKYHDVRFILEGGKSVFSHRIFLCSVSSFFRRLFLTNVSSKVIDVHNFGVKELNTGLVSGIHSVYVNEEGDQEVTVELTNDIKADTFKSLLTFVYTGSLPKKSEDVDLSDLKHVAQMFDIPRLVSICDMLLAAPVSQHESLLAENSGHQKGPTIAEFLKQELFSDIVFNVEGTEIPAHKVVVCARSKILKERVDKMCRVYASIGVPAYKMVQRAKKLWEKPMTDPRKEDEDTRVVIPVPNFNADIFSAFLQYLYTDHVDYDKSIDACDLAVLANKNYVFRLARQSECFRMGLEVADLLKNLRGGEFLDIFELCKKFQKSCASDMIKWSHHYMAVNYSKFKEKIESEIDHFGYLRRVQLQRWPPIHYLNQVEDFEMKLMKADLVNSWRKRQIPIPLCSRFKLCGDKVVYLAATIK